MIILAIETSCDDTGIAILEIKGDKSPSFNVLSNIVSSQIEVHKKYGGIYPAMAKREHQKNLVPVLIKALREAKLLKSRNKNQKINSKTIEDILKREPELIKKILPFLKKYGKPDAKGSEPRRRIDLIAVTEGPGLEPCLWVGINFARALSYFWDIPIVPVNHIESHILVNFLENPSAGSGQIKFPAVCLVVSGGHTQLILMKGVGKYKILGETRDDAAGECFDKCAKILGLNYPGGPAIAELAEDGLPPIGGSPSSAKLPRPMINTKDYDFSFSGLKTAVLYKWREIYKKNLPRDERQRILRGMATEIQQAIIDVLIKKTIKASKDYNSGKIPTASPSRIRDGKAIGTIILGGGVSANQELRKQFLQSPGFNIIFPPTNLSTDNALMTAIAGYFHKTKKIAWQKLKAKANLRIR